MLSMGKGLSSAQAFRGMDGRCAGESVFGDQDSKGSRTASCDISTSSGAEWMRMVGGRDSDRGAAREVSRCAGTTYRRRRGRRGQGGRRQARVVGATRTRTSEARVPAQRGEAWVVVCRASVAGLRGGTGARRGRYGCYCSSPAGLLRGGRVLTTQQAQTA
jgi:hypothetical protein